MTTIAYKDGVLASDSRGNRGNAIEAGSSRKVWSFPDGRLLGICGGYASAVRFVEWMRQGGAGAAPHLDDNSTIIEVRPDRSILIHEQNGSYPAEGSDYFAWGSGTSAALGAFFVGATAEQAVEAACSVDPYSGGAVQVARLKSQPRAVTTRLKVVRKAA